MADSPLIGISLGSRRSLVADVDFLAIMPTYTQSILQAGGAPVLIPLNLGRDVLRQIYNRLDGILLSGGGDIAPERYGVSSPSPYVARIEPTRDEVEIHLANWAVADNKPLLAICRGIQVLNVALGGSLIQDIREEVPGALRHDAPDLTWFTRRVHAVQVTASSKLASSLGLDPDALSLEVNSLHHQALKNVAAELTVVAWAQDGIVEGVELPGHCFALGVQWHPEALVDLCPHMLNLFTAFVCATTGDSL
nr:gamma-glutamyl-gamma-aminobutyrate hydrolase family protein [Anaerolineae bacterium]